MATITKLEKLSIEARGKQHNEYFGENPYDERIVNKVLESSDLKKEATESREKSHPILNMEFEEPYKGEGYGLKDVKKGRPGDGGHTHTIPTETYSKNLYLHQLETEDAGDEKDIEQREYLLGINKYNKVRSYANTNIDLGRPELDGQYFIN